MVISIPICNVQLLHTQLLNYIVPELHTELHLQVDPITGCPGPETKS